MNTKILVVEDDSTLAVHLERLLRGWGYETVVAHSGVTALELAGDERPDLALMDVHLDEDVEAMDGIDAARELRARFDIPSIYLTAYAGDDFFQRARQTEPYGYLVKPLQEPTLQSTLEMAVYMAGINAKRKHWEETLRKKQSMLSRTERIAHIGSWEWDIATGDITWSPELFRIFNMDIHGKAPSWPEHEGLCPPEDSKRLRQAAETAISDAKPYELELRILRKDGVTRIGLVKGFPETDAGGKVVRLIGFLQDITERKQAKRKLRESEAKYRALFDNMAQGVFYKQADGTMTDVNNALLDMFGLTRDEFLERNSMDERWKVIHEDGSEFQGSEHPSMVALRTGLPVRNVVAGIFNPQKNDYVWLNINAIPQFEPGATQPDQAIVTFHDITEIKKAEKAILNHHRYLEAIKEIGALATSTLELKSLLERILDGILNVVGASAGMIFLKDLAAGHLSWGASTGLSDDFVAEYENKTIKPGEGLTGRISEDGEPIFIQQNSSNDARVARRITIRENLNSFIGVPLRAGKEVIGVMNILSRPPVVLREQDVVLVGAIASHVGAAIQNARLYNQIRETQAALQESERHHRLLIESTMEGYWHVNARFQTLDVNAALCRMLGYTYEEMLAKTPFDVVDDKNRKIFEARASTLLSTKHRSYDIVLQKKNGEKLYAHFNATTLPDNSGSFAFVTDITDLKRAEAKLKEYSEHLENRVEARTRELKKAQEELLAKERLALLGHFAGSVSHELRNPLAAIDAAVYLLNMKLKNADASIGQCLAGVSNNVKKSTAIIQSLLSLSRMEKPKTDAVDAEELIATTLESAKVPKTVQVVSNPPEDPVFLRIDPEQVRMAIKNIVQNAVQAMEDAGKITISVHSQEPATADIVIADTGPGIPPEQMEKVFEPLFSTKTHGIGFGLSITKMIVENHGGTIRAEAPVDGGARFVMTFPRQQTCEVSKTSQVSKKGDRSND